MIRSIAIAAVAAALAGCGTTLPREVLVPYPVYCEVNKPAKPKWATDSMPKDADIYDQAKHLLAERRQRIGYEGQLEAAIDGCQPPAK